MGSSFNMTIGTHPSSDLNLEKEVQLVKVGLLYADKVKLCSPNSSMILSILGISKMNKIEKLQFLKEVAPALNISNQQIEAMEQFIDLYKKMESKKNLSKQDILVKIKMRQELDKLYKSLDNELESLFKHSKADQLDRAINSNKLDIEIYGTNDMDFDDIVEQFMKSIKTTIENGDTYPLFDDGISDIVRCGSKEGIFNFRKSTSEKTKHMGFVSDIMHRLPCFEYATIDEILDIRKELENPLRRFRSAIIKSSEEIRYEVWDQDFTYDADKLFRKEIEPSIVEIEELVQSNKYLKKLTSNILSNPLEILKSSGLGLLVGKLSDLPNISAEAMSIGAGVANTAFRTWKEYGDQNKKIEQNQMYFYYRAGIDMRK